MIKLALRQIRDDIRQKVLRLKPLRQVGEGTCWLYSVVHLIMHSRILKRNIKYAVISSPQLQKDVWEARKNVYKNGQVCGIKHVYYDILQQISSDFILERNLANFMKHMRNPRNLRKAGTNAGSILSIHGNPVEALFRILKMFGLPKDTVSLVPKPGYKLEGALIRYRHPEGHYHIVSGVLDRFRRPHVINSWNQRTSQVNWKSPLYSAGEDFSITKVYVRPL